MALVENLGFDKFDAGSIAAAWRQQPGQPAYCTDPTRAELALLLKRADQQKAPGKRDTAMRMLARLPSDYPAEALVRVSRLSVGLDRLKSGSWIAMLGLGVTLLRSSR